MRIALYLLPLLALLGAGVFLLGDSDSDAELLLDEAAPIAQEVELPPAEEDDDPVPEDELIRPAPVGVAAPDEASGPGRISGRLLDPAGKPSAGARLSLSHRGKTRGRKITRIDVLTRDDGSFDFENLALGAWTLDGNDGSFSLPRSYRLGLREEAPRITRDFHLDRGFQLRGQIQYDDGSPAVGVTVSLDANRQKGRDSLPKRKAVCDAEGRYLFQGLRKNNWWRIRCQAERGFLHRNPKRFKSKADKTQDLRLTRYAGLSGIVRGLDGEPAAEVRVAATGVGFVTTKKDGRFHFDKLRPSKAVELLAATVDESAAHFSKLELKAGERREGMELALAATPLLTGRVIDGKGKPVTNATINFARRDTKRITSLSGLNPKGWGGQFVNRPGNGLRLMSGPYNGSKQTFISGKRLVLNSPPIGDLQKELAKGEPQILDVMLSDPTNPNAPITISGLHLNNYNSSTLTLGSPGGWVTSGNFEPVPCKDDDPLRRSETARTDDEGRFSFRCLRPGPYWVSARAPHTFKTEASRELTPEEDTELEDFVLRRGAVIELEVLEPDGSPCPEFMVTWRQKKSHRSQRGTKGRAIIRGVKPGNVRITVSSQKNRDLISDAQSFEVDYEQHIPGLSFQLLPGAVVEGRVVDGDGFPVAGAKVKIGGRTVKTNREGEFHRGGLEPRSYRATVTAKGHMNPPAQKLKIVARERVWLDFTISRGITIEGTTLDASGQPLGGVHVFLRAKKRRLSGRSDKNGRFSFTKVLPDEYIVYARTNDRAHNHRSVRKLEGQGTQPLRLQLDAAYSAQGRYEAPAGSVVEGLSITAAAIDNSGLTRSAKLAIDGSFQIPHLYPGEYALTIKGVKHRKARVRVGPGIPARSVTLR